MKQIPSEIRALYDRHLKNKTIQKKDYFSYRKWLRYYFDFCVRYRHNQLNKESLKYFIAKLKENIGKLMIESTEKFTISFTDKGVLIVGGEGNRLEFSAGEALMLLDVLKNEEVELRRKAEDASPLPFKIQI
ncbi:hypothetical protein ACFL7M_01500 [Thermodesulfobacteriota bacterium]